MLHYFLQLAPPPHALVNAMRHGWKCWLELDKGGYLNYYCGHHYPRH